jgi:3-methylcrotonyl-CoA carboxylase beta subunit
MLIRAPRLSPLASRSITSGRRALITQPPHRLVSPRPLPTTFRASSDDAIQNKQMMKEAIDIAQGLRDKAREGGGKAVLEKWKSRGKGKLGVRERWG